MILSKISYLEVRKICETNLDIMITKIISKITTDLHSDRTYEQLQLTIHGQYVVRLSVPGVYRSGFQFT